MSHGCDRCPLTSESPAGPASEDHADSQEGASDRHVSPQGRLSDTRQALQAGHRGARAQVVKWGIFGER